MGCNNCLRSAAHVSSDPPVVSGHNSSVDNCCLLVAKVKIAIAVWSPGQINDGPGSAALKIMCTQCFGNQFKIGWGCQICVVKMTFWQPRETTKKNALKYPFLPLDLVQILEQISSSHTLDTGQSLPARYWCLVQENTLLFVFRFSGLE